MSEEAAPVSAPGDVLVGSFLQQTKEGCSWLLPDDSG